jgi:histidinol-phosphatase (PHP family)
MRIPQDYHMHSNFSCDCESPMAMMCRSAIARGIPEIGFTEHHDLHPGDPNRNWFKPQGWWAELERCRAEFAGQLTIRAGIEIGEPHIYAEEARAVVSQLPFDYLLGSLHWVGADSVFDPNYFRKHPAEVTYLAFFEELERMTRVADFDILSHLDVPVRTAHAIYGGYDPQPYEDAIRPVLRNCIERGIALDLNTAALRRAANIMTPGPTILRWYVEMGGERVTLGSDAHQPNHVGSHLDVAIELAKAAGLRYVTQFERRQPRMILLD